MLLSIIIVNWNVIELLANCLESIRVNLKGIEYEVIVVDNASIDGSATIIRSRYPWVRVIANQRNEGFSRANNQGLRVATGEYLLLLNPDTLIKDDSIQKLMAVLERNQSIGIVGPRLVDADGVVSPDCKRKRTFGFVDQFLDRFLVLRVLAFFIRCSPTLNKLYQKRFYRSEACSCLVGACMLTRRGCLDVVGYFDETVPMYLDDVDFCYRFRKAGLDVYYCAEAEIVHFCGASTKKSVEEKMVYLLACQAADVFFKKHRTRFHIVIHRCILFFSSLLLLTVDFALLPVTLFTHRIDVVPLIKKHLQTIRYSLTGRLNVVNFSE